MNKRMFVTLISVLSVIFIISTGFLVKHYYDSKQQAELYDDLIEIVEDTTKDTTNDVEPIPYDENTSFLQDYQELYMQNNDMVGWIKIEDTKVNYPVMQTKDNANYYLRRSFDKSYSLYGCPYVQENCDVEKPSDNTIIYGHHMNDGSMFAGLMKYANKSFYENHKTITYDSLTEHREYEVIAVFKTVAYNESGFKYYHFVDAENEDDFNEYVSKCKELSLYEIPETAQYGDKLITLSTCEYSRTDGRFVVVAKLKMRQ